jgi:hypothetical protein
MLCRLYYVMCDGCGELGEYGDTGQEARRWTRRWKRIPKSAEADRGKDFCPRCVKEGKA